MDAGQDMLEAIDITLSAIHVAFVTARPTMRIPPIRHARHISIGVPIALYGRRKRDVYGSSHTAHSPMCGWISM